MKQNLNTNWWAFGLPISAVLIWSFNLVVTRYAADIISPVSISFYRWFIAFTLLTPFILPKVWQQRALVSQHLAKFAVLAAFGMVLYQGLAYTAAHYTTATNMGIINAFVPIFTIFVSILLLKENPNRFALIGSAVSFFGLLYVMSQGHLAVLLQAGGHWGDLMMVAAVFFYAFYGVLLKKWALQVPLLISLYVQIVFALLYHLPFIAWFGLERITVENGPILFFSGLFPSLISPLLWMFAIQQIGPNRTSIFMNLMPLFTAIIASVWLAEKWTIAHTLGGLLILIGIITAQKKTSLGRQ